MVFIIQIGHIINMSLETFFYLVWAVSTTTSLMTRAERLERRRQSKAYKQAMSNLNLQFISEFLHEKPPTSPPVNDFNFDFDPSGLGDESHFALLWLLPGILISLLTLALYLTVCWHEHRDHRHGHT